MQNLPLGTSGLVVPDTCLGTMTWGNQTPLADAHRQIDMALDHGLTFLDTAEMYPVNPVRPETLGHSEAAIGAWITAGGRADRLTLATKVSGKGSEVMPGGTPPITPARLRSAVEASLSRLQVDHIALFQLHWPNRGGYHFRQNWTYRPPAADARAAIVEDIAAVLAEAGRLQSEGKIGAFGVSNETTWGTAQWLAAAEAGAGPRLASVQNEYSLLNRLADTDLAELLSLERVTLLAYSPLGTGLLTGKYAGDVVPEGSRRSGRPDLGGRITPRVFEAVAAYLGLAREAGLDPVAMAIAWCRQRPFPCIPILGATTAGQLERLLPALDLTLPADLTAAIDAVHRAHPMPF